MNVNTAIEILQKEINWCLDNPDGELNKDQQIGFVNGLRQAQIILRRPTTHSLDAVRRCVKCGGTAFRKIEGSDVCWACNTPHK